MTTNVECYLTYKKDTKKSQDTHITSGVVLFHEDEEVLADFKTVEDGMYLDMMLEHLFKTIDLLFNRTMSGVVVNVRVHPRNTNFFKVFDKILKGYEMTKAVDSEASRQFILDQLFTRKDYHKPKSFDWMMKIAKALYIANQKQPFNVFITRDGNSLRAERTYFECCSRQTAYRQEKPASNVIAFPST